MENKNDRVKRSQITHTGVHDFELCGNNLLLADGGDVLIYSLIDGSVTQLSIPDKQLDDIEQEKKKQSNPGYVSGSLISCLKANFDGTRLCVGDEQGQLLIFDTSTWTCVYSCVLERRVILASFDCNGKDVVICDKTGAVIKIDYSVVGSEQKAKVNDLTHDKTKLHTNHTLLTESLSVVKDLKVLNGNRMYVCDRDERIMVCKYPQVYDIQAFCMKHTEMITCLLPLRRRSQIFISCGCDGRVCFWDSETGDLKFCANLPEDNGRAAHITSIAVNEELEHVYIVCEGRRVMYVLNYSVEKNSAELMQEAELNAPTLKAICDNTLVYVLDDNAVFKDVKDYDSTISAFKWTGTKYIKQDIEAIENINKNLTKRSSNLDKTRKTRTPASFQMKQKHNVGDYKVEWYKERKNKRIQEQKDKEFKKTDNNKRKVAESDIVIEDGAKIPKITDNSNQTMVDL